MSLPPWVPNPADISDGQFLQWDAASGRFLAVDSPSGPDLGASSIVVQTTTGNNLFDLDADQGDYVISTGPDYSVLVAGTGWALTTEAGILTYTGTLTRRAMLVIDTALQGNVITDSCNFGIAVNGDLIGATPGFQASTMFWSPTDGVNNITTRRIVTLANGLTFQAVCSGATATNAQISRMIMSAIIL